VTARTSRKCCLPRQPVTRLRFANCSRTAMSRTGSSASMLTKPLRSASRLCSPCCKSRTCTSTTLGDLARRVGEAGGELPVPVASLQELTPWAVVFRYDDALEDEPLKRAEVLALVVEVGKWAEGQVAARIAE
jgi:hypothetical protein